MFFNGDVLPVLDGDGFVGRLPPGKAKIVVTVDPEAEVYGFSISGRKTIVPKSGKSYKAMVDVRVGPGFNYPFFPNNFCLLQFGQADVKVWEVSLIGCKGNFFFRVQLLHEADLYSEGGKLRSPYLAGEHKWPELVTFCQKLLDEKVASLPDISTYKPSNGRVNLPPNQGLVIHVRYARSFAVLATASNGNVLVLPEDMPTNGNSFPKLHVGDTVEFRRLMKLEPRFNKFGKRRDVNFQHSALGVSVVS